MIEFQTDSRKVAHITLARPDAANALSGEMLRQLLARVRKLAASDARIVVLRAAGKHFCAGADIQWMRQSADLSEQENQREAQTLADLLLALHALPQPLLVATHGACYGGGAGFAAVADICISADNATFCFSEVRLGLIPATISPYVVRAIGERQARRYFLNAAAFSADTASAIGLVHQLVPAAQLDDALEHEIAALLAGGAQAQREIKTLLADVRSRAPDNALAQDTARTLARVRMQDEAREGIAAFLEKREPRWRKK